MFVDPISGFLSGLAMSAGAVETGVAILEAGATIGSAFEVAGAVGAGLSAIDAISGKVSQDEANYRNELAAAEQAANVAVETEQSEKQTRRAGYLLQSSQAAAAGANSGGIGSTALDLMSDSAAQNALDLLTIQRTGLQSQKKIKTDAKNATKANTTSWLSAGTKALTSGSKLLASKTT